MIELPEIALITEITVRSPTRGWAFELFAAPGSPVGASWGDPIRTQTGIRSDTVLDIGELEAKSLLLWIVDLGDGPTYRVTVTDIEIDGIAEIDEGS